MRFWNRKMRGTHCCSRWSCIKIDSSVCHFNFYLWSLYCESSGGLTTPSFYSSSIYFLNVLYWSVIGHCFCCICFTVLSISIRIGSVLVLPSPWNNVLHLLVFSVLLYISSFVWLLVIIASASASALFTSVDCLSNLLFLWCCYYLHNTRSFSVC